jgi:hypothetical protein
MDDDGHKLLNERMTERAMDLQCVVSYAPERRKAFAEVYRRIMGLNSYAQIPFCDRTIFTHIKLAGGEEFRNACVKTKARADAKRNIRNGLSLVCAINYIFQRVSPPLYFSVDDTSLLVNEHHKPKVIATSTAKEYLDSTNTAPSVVEEETQRRVITFNCTISPTKLICTVIKITDKLFANFNGGKPYVVELEPRLYAMCYVHGESEVTISRYIYELCILPCCEAEKQYLINENLQRLVPLNVSVPTETEMDDRSEPPQDLNLPISAEEEKAVREMFKYMCLSSDGAYAQIRAIQDSLMDRCIRKALLAIWHKYGGGCSMSQSPNDVGRHHAIIKSCYGSSSFRYDKVDYPKDAKFLAFRDKLEAVLEPSSFRTFWKAVAQARIYLGKAFSAANIQRAYQDVGIYPFDPHTIMKHCPHYNTMPDEKVEWLLRTGIPQLSACFEDEGFISEEKFETILGQCVGVDNCKVKTSGMDLNKMVLSRQRCTVFSHPAFVESVKAKRLEQEAAEARRLEEERAAQGANGEGDGAGQAAGKRVRTAECANSDCNAEHLNADKQAWVVCKNKKAKKDGSTKVCGKKFCNNEVCSFRLTQHMLICK